MPEVPDHLKYSQDHLWVRPAEVVDVAPPGPEIDPAMLDRQLAALMDAGAYRALAGE